jgi:hypothetical protein
MDLPSLTRVLIVGISIVVLAAITRYLFKPLNTVGVSSSTPSVANSKRDY